MEDVIQIIKKEIAENVNTHEKIRLIELLVRAQTISILRQEVVQGTGYAIEAVGKIAAFGNFENSSNVVDSQVESSKIVDRT
ncbi:hypothetical protein [Desulfoluna spongiiphila]|uniref:hypothetical protein n=1 Tax=Desulfoluna spongiiphila TaxID=419481 RepID=UPI00125ED335|nr:hypothetical protein [Desulfoluna spongiiphila]